MSRPVNTWNTLQETDEIRLLQLQPGSGSDIINCTFSHVRLSENPQYEALSYMWGPEHDLRMIEINEGFHYIRENLWQALWSLRSPDTSRTLWADALCINQLDKSERTHQVTQMGAIYSHANSVCVWLCPSDDSSDAAFEFLGREPVLRDLRAGFIEFPSHWEDIARLGDRPYWHRLWIIQEVILAKKVIIYSGKLTLPWETLSTIFHFFKTQRLFARHETTGEMRFSSELPVTRMITGCMASALMQLREDRLGQVSQDQRQRHEKFEKSILYLANHYQHANCEDVRDKIYGLHSLAPPCCRKAVPIDYDCSAYTLCGRLLEHHLSKHTRSSEQDPVKLSHDIHKLIQGGEIRQRGSRNSFSSGEPEQIAASELHGNNSSQNDDIKVQASGCIVDTVVFVSPALRHFTPVEAARFQKSPKSLRQELVTTPPPKFIAERINHALDLIRRAVKSDDHTNQRRLSLLQKKRRLELIKVSELHCLWMELFEQVSNALQHYPRAQDCVIFVGRYGSIGLAAVETDIDDKICTFNSSGIAAVTRPMDLDRYQIISRCCSRSAPQSRYYPPESLVSISMSELQVLTRISDYSFYYGEDQPVIFGDEWVKTHLWSDDLDENEFEAIRQFHKLGQDQ
jgi:hypothetical protein